MARTYAKRSQMSAEELAAHKKALRRAKYLRRQGGVEQLAKAKQQRKTLRQEARRCVPDLAWCF